MNDPEEAAGLELEDRENALVVQTTFRESKYEEILKIINEKKNKTVSANNTICSATEERQSESCQNIQKCGQNVGDW